MPYRTQSLDTSPETERVQFEVLRRMGPGKRYQRMRSLSRTQMRLAWGGLKRANPHLSERELQIKAVTIWYSEELGERLRTALAARDREDHDAT